MDALQPQTYLPLTVRTQGKFTSFQEFPTAIAQTDIIIHARGEIIPTEELAPLYETLLANSTIINRGQSRVLTISTDKDLTLGSKIKAGDIPLKDMIKLAHNTGEYILIVNPETNFFTEIRPGTKKDMLMDKLEKLDTDIKNEVLTIFDKDKRVPLFF
jgi:hypothetical protein